MGCVDGQEIPHGPGPESGMEGPWSVGLGLSQATPDRAAKLGPRPAPIHSHPRFQALLEKYASDVERD